MQLRLEPLRIQRVREDYPPINYVDEKGIQWIELNRGCKRMCEFCWADPNYKVFDVPKIVSNRVQIIGENILYDPNIANKLLQLSDKRVNKKVVYYGICNGLDYRLLTVFMMEILTENRFGSINNKGNWRKGVSIAWDLWLGYENKIKQTVDNLVDVGFNRKSIMIHVLTNWKVNFKNCMYKLSKIKDWDVMIDDCTWECTKKNFLPMYWTYREHREFRHLCREHNKRWAKSTVTSSSIRSKDKD